MRLTSSAECFSFPLNAMCSRKWLTPETLVVSSRAPVRTKKPAATESTVGFSSATMESPLSSVVSRNVTGLLQCLWPDGQDREVASRVSVHVFQDVLHAESVDLIADFRQGGDAVEMI